MVKLKKQLVNNFLGGPNFNCLEAHKCLIKFNDKCSAMSSNPVTWLIVW